MMMLRAQTQRDRNEKLTPFRNNVVRALNTKYQLVCVLCYL